MEHFFPQIQVKTKKKRSSTRIEHFFPQIYMLTCTPIQIIGGDADVDHSQTIGRDTAKLLGRIYPPPLFRHPCYQLSQAKNKVVTSEGD